MDVRFAGEADGKCQLGFWTDWDARMGSPLLAWTEDGRASVGLGSARKDSSAIAIGEEGCAVWCWISEVRLLCDALALCTRYI